MTPQVDPGIRDGAPDEDEVAGGEVDLVDMVLGDGDVPNAGAVSEWDWATWVASAAAKANRSDWALAALVTRPNWRGRMPAVVRQGMVDETLVRFYRRSLKAIREVAPGPRVIDLPFRAVAAICRARALTREQKLEYLEECSRMPRSENRMIIEIKNMIRAAWQSRRIPKELYVRGYQWPEPGDRAKSPSIEELEKTFTPVDSPTTVRIPPKGTALLAALSEWVNGWMGEHLCHSDVVLLALDLANRYCQAVGRLPQETLDTIGIQRTED